MRKSLLDYTTSQDENEIAIAVSKGRHIYHIEKTDLLDYISKVRMLLGVQKDYKNSEELALATNYVKSNYYFLTTDEFELAFNLFVLQRYDADIQFYGIFSPLFISQVLDAYKNYKDSKLALVKMRIEKDVLKEEAKSKKPTKEQIAETQKVIITQFWNDWKQKGDFTDILSLSYNFFYKNKQLFKFTFDEKKIIDAQEWANKKMIQDRSKGGFFKFNEKDEILQKKRYCRIWCVMDFFSRFETVDEILNLITPELWS